MQPTEYSSLFAFAFALIVLTAVVSVAIYFGVALWCERAGNKALGKRRAPYAALATLVAHALLVVPHEAIKTVGLVFAVISWIAIYFFAMFGIYDRKRWN